MPIVEVWGVAKHPSGHGLKQLRTLANDLREAVAGVEGLALEPSAVSVFFPADYRDDTELRESVMKKREPFSIAFIEETIVAFVRGLNVPRDLPLMSRAMISRRIADCLLRTAANQKAAWIEVFVDPFPDHHSGHTVLPVTPKEAAE
jgi:hypothetical protein